MFQDNILDPVQVREYANNLAGVLINHLIYRAGRGDYTAIDN